MLGNQAWTPTGQTVRQGDASTFSATGEMQLSTDASDIGDRQRRALGPHVGSRRRCLNVSAGALIAKVGNSPPFPIGENADGDHAGQRAAVPGHQR